MWAAVIHKKADRTRKTDHLWLKLWSHRGRALAGIQGMQIYENALCAKNKRRTIDLNATSAKNNRRR